MAAARSTAIVRRRALFNPYSTHRDSGRTRRTLAPAEMKTTMRPGALTPARAAPALHAAARAPHAQRAAALRVAAGVQYEYPTKIFPRELVKFAGKEEYIYRCAPARAGARGGGAGRGLGRRRGAPRPERAAQRRSGERCARMRARAARPGGPLGLA